MKQPTTINAIAVITTAFAALLPGMAIGLWLAGVECDTLREWVSALGGWFAAIIAGAIGLATLRPIARQARIQEASYSAEAADRFRKAKRDMMFAKPSIETGNQIVDLANAGILSRERAPAELIAVAPNLDEPPPEHYVEMCERASTKIAVARDTLAMTTFPGTRIDELPIVASHLEAALSDLVEEIEGIKRDIQWIDQLRKSQRNATTDELLPAIIGRMAERKTPIITGEPGKSDTPLLDYVDRYTKLLDAEIARHR